MSVKYNPSINMHGIVDTGVVIKLIKSYLTIITEGV